MFKFLKEKLKEAVSKFSKKVEEEAPEEEIVEEKEIKLDEKSLKEEEKKIAEEKEKKKKELKKLEDQKKKEEQAKKEKEAELKKEEEQKEKEEERNKREEEKKKKKEEEKEKKEEEEKKKKEEEERKKREKERKKKEEEIEKIKEEKVRLQKEEELKILKEEERRREAEIKKEEEEKKKEEERKQREEEERKKKEEEKAKKEEEEQKRKEEEKKKKEEEEEQKRKEEEKEKKEEELKKLEEQEEEIKEKRGFFSRIKEKFIKKKEEPEEEKEVKIAEKKEEPEEEKKEIKEIIKEEKEVEIEEVKEEKKGFFARVKQKVTTKRIDSKQFDELFWELELALLENNVAVEVIEKIKEDLKNEIVDTPIRKSEIQTKIMESLKKSIEDLFEFSTIDLVEKVKSNEKPYVIIFIGVNGSGKTTTIAKVAKMMLNNGLKPIIAAADTFRAAAIHQIEEHGKNLGVKVVKHDYGADPSAVAFDAIKAAKAHNIDVVLIDTAGRMHSNINLVSEMQKIVRVAKPDMKIFVGEAITGNDCVEQAKVFNNAVELDGIILAKADIDEKGGAAVSISYVTGKPILYFGTGQEYEDIEKFDKEKIIKNIGL